MFKFTDVTASHVLTTIHAQAATFKLSHAALATQAIQISFKMQGNVYKYK